MPDEQRPIEATFPTLGLDVSTEFDLQPAATTPEATNVRGFESLTQRDRGGSRPGLIRYPDERLPLDAE
jgi:hypothetical protein